MPRTPKSSKSKKSRKRPAEESKVSSLIYSWLNLNSFWCLSQKPPKAKRAKTQVKSFAKTGTSQSEAVHKAEAQLPSDDGFRSFLALPIWNEGDWRNLSTSIANLPFVKEHKATQCLSFSFGSGDDGVRLAECEESRWDDMIQIITPLLWQSLLTGVQKNQDANIQDFLRALEAWDQNRENGQNPERTLLHAMNCLEDAMESLTSDS